jgi:hypothetical protein
VIACRISTPRPITVCSVYLPPANTWNCNDLLVLVSQLQSPVMLVGDFKAHNSLWRSTTTDNRGLEVADFILQGNLYLVNTKDCTCIHPATGSRSSIDMSFCDPTLFTEYVWSVHNDQCDSDHYPIVLSAVNSMPVANWLRQTGTRSSRGTNWGQTMPV